MCLLYIAAYSRGPCIQIWSVDVGLSLAMILSQHVSKLHSTDTPALLLLSRTRPKRDVVIVYRSNSVSRFTGCAGAIGLICSVSGPCCRVPRSRFWGRFGASSRELNWTSAVASPGRVVERPIGFFCCL
jgi:hypothetical protein